MPTTHQERDRLLELSLLIAGTGRREERRAQDGIDRGYSQRFGRRLEAFQFARGVRFLGREDGRFGGLDGSRKVGTVEAVNINRLKLL